jgi:iron complex outermembrane recepter protein
MQAEFHLAEGFCPLLPAVFLLSLVAVLAGSPARAQGAGPAATPSPSPSPAGGTLLLPPVQVNGATSPDRVSDPQQPASLSKTGTKLGELPASVQIIPRKLLTEQGATMLRQGVENASGINSGGQDALGYFDHFLIRGLNAQIMSDGFSDGDQLGGISHSLNGVDRVEILEGPGSALFGSGPPGGTINIVHAAPSSTFHYNIGEQYGAFDTTSTSASVTGPTGAKNLNFRVDTTLSHADGFRSLNSHDNEIRPALELQTNRHTVDFAVDDRDIHQTPDSYGIIYFNGSPITNVPIDAKYSSPFAFGNEQFIRPTLTDAWYINDNLTINNRFSFVHRTLDALRNGDSSSTKVTAGAVVGRQLRKQSDTTDSFDYQLEPVWKFSTGPVGHTLLTGFEYQHQSLATQRSTADLPNIPNAFAPVPPETSTAGLTFLCDAKHSCDDDQLTADYTSAYATDQIDLSQRWKLRLGVRQDWWDTTLNPLITVPGRFGANGLPIVAGVAQTRNDAPVSWNAGTLYKLLPWVSPYIGASQSYLTNFNSENTQNGIGAPESALEFEGGAKFALFGNRLTMSAAGFNIARNNVASLLVINGIETVVFDSQRTRGMEVSFDTDIASRVHLSGNATVQDAFITSNPQGVTSVFDRPQGVPAHMANLWTTYHFTPEGTPGLQLGAGANYRDKSYSDITNVNSVPSFVIANAMVGYETSQWGADVNLHNITNERYFIAPNGAGGFVGDPFSVYFSVHLNR